MPFWDFLRRRPAPAALLAVDARGAQPVPMPAPKTSTGALDAAWTAIQRLGVLTQHGTGIGTDIDPAVQVSFEAPTLLTREAVEAIYLSGEGRRLVEDIPADVIARGWAVTDDTSEPAPLADAQRDLHVEERIREASRYANLYGEGFLLVMVEEGGVLVEGADLAKPLDRDRVTGVRQIVALAGGLCYEVMPDRIDRTFAAGRWGQPETYTVMATRETVFLSGKVHATRLVRIAGDEVPATMATLGRAGTPMSVLQRGALAIAQWARVGAAMGRAADRITDRVLATPFGPSPDAPEAYIAAYLTRMAALKTASHLKTTVINTDERLEQLAFPVSGLAPLDDVSLTHLATAYGWPKERLAGLQPGGVINSGPAWESGWWALCDAWRETHLRAPLEWLCELLYLGTRGQVPADWSLAFPPLGTLAPLDAAALANTEAGILRQYMAMGVITAAEIRASKFGASATEPPAGMQALDPFPAAPAPAPLPSPPPAADADWTGTAVVSLDLAPAAVEEWRATRDAVIAAGIPLEGYAPGDELPDAPHLTVTYLGEVDPGDLGDLRAVLTEAAALASPALLRPLGVVAFDAKPGADRRPVVIELRPTGTLRDLAAAVLRASAPYVTAEQYVAPRYHVTLGFAADAPDLDDRLADLPPVLPLGTARLLTLRWSDREIARWDLRQGAPDA